MTDDTAKDNEKGLDKLPADGPKPEVDREVESASQPTGDEQVETEIVGGDEAPTADPAVAEAVNAALDEGKLPGNVVDDAPEVGEAQVEHATEAYNLDNPGAGAVEATVVEDLNARKGLASDEHREVTNDELGSLAIDPESLNTIRPEEKVQVVVRERTEEDANDFGIESTEQERIVKELAESGELFDKGGPLGDWTGNKEDLSDGVDGLFLAERSKQTGTKLF